MAALAAADTMLQDEPIKPSAPADIISMMSIDEYTGGDEIGDDIECFQHLLSTRATVRFSKAMHAFTLGA